MEKVAEEQDTFVNNKTGVMETGHEATSNRIVTQREHT
jgi:hypothetical protein